MIYDNIEFLSKYEIRKYFIILYKFPWRENVLNLL